MTIESELTAPGPTDRRGQTIEVETWIIELRSFPNDERPIGRRVAMLLKYAARTCGLKCIVVRDPSPEEDRL